MEAPNFLEFLDNARSPYHAVKWIIANQLQPHGFQ